MKITVQKSEKLSSRYEFRFVVVEKETGKVLDDAQGYGYKTVQKAYAAWNYKNRDKSKDKEKAKKRSAILKWMKEHKDFVESMNVIAFEIAKGSWGPEETFNAAFVKRMLEENNLHPDFTANELLKVWKKS